MAVRVSPRYQQQLMSHVLTEMAARQDREERAQPLFQVDINEWAERHFYIPLTAAPMKMPLHQKAVLRYFYTRREDHHFPFQNVIYSTIKKSGKSTTAGVVGRYHAETQTRYGEIFTIGNDLDQAKDRSFKEIATSLQMTPGYNRDKEVLPGRWICHKLSMRCLLTGSAVKAISVDAAGEAGGQPALTIWTELWGFEDLESRRFWDEMTPIPTVPDSTRLVETYAGYDGESVLLRSLYDAGRSGHQLTAGELASFVCREDVPGETFQDYVNAWHETRGDPNVVIPVWENNRLGMYWDSGMVARRMPWQHMFLPLLGVDPDGSTEEVNICASCRRPKEEHEIGITADEYYGDAERIGPPQAYQRLHLNEWVGAESAFIPLESWDACGHIHKVEMLQEGDRTPLVAAADAAVTGDCFGVLAVSRCPNDPNCVDLRRAKRWLPPQQGSPIDLSVPEAFLRTLPVVYNIVQIAYDPYQMESIAQRLTRDGIAWLKPFNQMGDRLKADSSLYDLIISNRIHYTHEDDCPGMERGAQCNCWVAPVREHLANANAKMQVNEDSKLRIVKKANGSKVDLAVCLSMATYRCLYLRLA